LQNPERLNLDEVRVFNAIQARLVVPKLEIEIGRVVVVMTADTDRLFLDSD
jgi:hypothetical protein